MKKFVVVLLLACLVFSVGNVFAAGNSDSSAEKKIRIAIVPVALNNPIFIDAIEASKKAGEELGIQILPTASANPDAAEQVKVVESLIEQQVDGILLFPVDSKALKGVVDKAIDKVLKSEFSTVIFRFQTFVLCGNRQLYSRKKPVAMRWLNSWVVKEMLSYKPV